MCASKTVDGLETHQKSSSDNIISIRCFLSFFFFSVVEQHFHSHTVYLYLIGMSSRSAGPTATTKANFLFGHNSFIKVTICYWVIRSVEVYTRGAVYCI